MPKLYFAVLEVEEEDGEEEVIAPKKVTKKVLPAPKTKKITKKVVPEPVEETEMDEEEAEEEEVEVLTTKLSKKKIH